MLLRGAFVAYALWLVGACFVQRRILFPSFAVQAPASGGFELDGFERHWLETEQGKTEWWFLRHPEASAESPKPLLVFAHGNGEVIDSLQDEVEGYRALGFHVLLCEYRGYGRSEGTSSQDAILSDHKQALTECLARPEVSANGLVYHGRSLGSGVVCQLALHQAPEALILASPFTSIADIMAGFLVPRPLVFDPFDNEAVLEKLHLPTLIFHGERDGTVPYAHGLALSKLRDSIELVSFPKSAHNDMPMNSAKVWGQIEGFLRDKGVETGGVLAPAK